MKPLKALTLSLGELQEPVITHYQLGLIIHNLYRQKEYRRESVNLKKDYAERSDFNYYLSLLLDEGVLNQSRGLPKRTYALLGNTRWDADEVACTVDPFAYISHLSAMSYHGLTDRIPAHLYLSSPSPSMWREFAEDRMKKDLSADYEHYRESGLPILSRTELQKIGKTKVHRMSSTHLGAFKWVRDRNIRVATIGRTFLDMLRNPELCGGINHVLRTFDEYAETHLRLITDEITDHGKAIEKVRAGYILDERLHIENDVIESWAKFAQRGGSRKLDASAEYEPVWSDKWCISINTFEKKIK